MRVIPVLEELPVCMGRSQTLSGPPQASLGAVT